MRIQVGFCYLALLFRVASSTEVDNAGFVKPVEFSLDNFDQSRGDGTSSSFPMDNDESMGTLQDPTSMKLNITMEEHEHHSMGSTIDNVRLRRRRLLEYDPNSAPENNIHNTLFTGYQNSSVAIQPWMVTYLSRINEIRLEEGISNPLCFNEILMKAAKKHMDDMVANDEELQIGHTGSDGLNSGQRLTREGYTYTHYGATIFAQTDCLSIECSLNNRPVFFSERGIYNQFGIAKEDGAPLRGPRWYYIFASSDVDNCMGMDVNMLDWVAGTPTQPPKQEVYLPPPVPGDGADMVEVWMVGLLSLLNAERVHAGVSDFCFNQKLMLAAKAHNDDMLAQNYYSHNSKEGGGGPSTRAAAEGYTQQSFIAENLAKGEENYRSAMFAWMSSKKGHGYNIINREAVHIGIARDETEGLYTLVMGSYMNDQETCIPSIGCEGFISYVSDDPIFDKYACSYCRQRTEEYEYGNMGCGFGIAWYKSGNLKLKLELYLSLDGIDSLDILGPDVAKFTASIEDPVFELVNKTTEGNVTVEVVSIGGTPVGSSERRLADNAAAKSVDIQVEITVQTECMVYGECHNQKFMDDIKDNGMAAITESCDSGALLTSIKDEAVKNDCAMLLNVTIDPKSVKMDQGAVEVEEDELAMTSYPTQSPTFAPTPPPACVKPPIFCTHPGSTYLYLDCDEDGTKDHLCRDSTSYWLIKTSEPCTMTPDAYPISGIQAACPPLPAK